MLEYMSLTCSSIHVELHTFLRLSSSVSVALLLKPLLRILKKLGDSCVALGLVKLSVYFGSSWLSREHTLLYSLDPFEVRSRLPFDTVQCSLTQDSWRWSED